MQGSWERYAALDQTMQIMAQAQHICRRATRRERPRRYFGGQQIPLSEQEHENFALQRLCDARYECNGDLEDDLEIATESFLDSFEQKAAVWDDPPTWGPGAFWSLGRKEEAGDFWTEDDPNQRETEVRKTLTLLGMVESREDDYVKLDP